MPPLYNVFGYLSIKATGQRDFGFRLPSVLFSTLTIFSLAALARAVFAPAAGIFAALFAAFSPIAIRYGYDARPYAMEAFFISLVWILLHQMPKSRAGVWNFLFPVILLLACLSHYFAMIPIGALLLLYFGLPWLYARYNKVPIPIVIISAVLFVGASLFHYWLVSRQNISRSVFFTDYTPGFLWSYFSMLWQTDVIGLETPMWQDISLVAPVLLLLIALGVYSLRKDVRVSGMVLVLIFGVVGIPLVAKISQNLLSVRFSMFALPCMILFAACGMGLLWRQSTRRWSQGTLKSVPLQLICFGTLAIVLYVLTSDAKNFIHKPYFHEWREKASYLESVLKRYPGTEMVTKDSVVQRNVLFYTTKPVAVRQANTQESAPPVKPHVAIDIGKAELTRLYGRFSEVATPVEVTGVVPPVLVVFPTKFTPTETSQSALTELSYMHQFAVPERRSWVNSQMGQIAQRLDLTPLQNISFQLLFLNGESDIARGYALWQLGLPEAAEHYYERFFVSTPKNQIKDYMINQYKGLKEELRK